MHQPHQLLFATITLCLLVVVGSQGQPLDAPGVLVVNRSSLLRTFTAESCSSATGKIAICSSCTSLSFCLGGNSIADAACPGSNPYCNPGEVAASCLTTPAPGCGPQPGAVNPIVCTGLGVLPDPNNCKIYHVCRNLQQNSDVYQCPPGYHFNLTTQWCRSDQAEQCVQINCGTTSGFVYYGTSRQYFVYCALVNGVSSPASIFKCPNRATFSLTSFSCVFQCPGQGNFENSDDPSSFYQCFVANGQSVVTLQRCPTGTTFKQALQYCA